MWGPRFILVTHLHGKICFIGYEEFGFWYNFVLLLLWTDVIATNIAETVRRNLQGLLTLIFPEVLKILIALNLTRKKE